MKEGKVSKWFKKEGDPVKEGDELFEGETEKIINKVEAPTTGILFQVVVPAGRTVRVGTIVAIISEPGEHIERIDGIKSGESGEGAELSSKSPKAVEKPGAPGVPGDAVSAPLIRVFLGKWILRNRSG